jgi:hypothetical protein
MGSEQRRSLTHFLRVFGLVYKKSVWKYEQAQHLKPGEFKRLWGVKLETFQHMGER